MTARARVGAAIDVGSNSIHLLIAVVGRTRLRVLVDESVQLGLGTVVDREGRLTGEAREAAVAVIAGYVDRARTAGAERVTLVGTEPLRRASNRSVLQADVLRTTGVPLHVLSHEAEAELTLLGVTGGQAPARPLLVLDIGGGSTELILASAGNDPVVGAVPTGSSRLAAQFIAHDPPTWFELNGLREVAVRMMAVMPAGRPEAGTLVGGTAANTNKLLGRDRLAPLDRVAFESALMVVSSAPAAELAATRLLSERRVRQLGAGIAVAEAALARYELGHLETSDASLREGAVLAAARAGDAWPAGLSSLLRG